MASSAPALYRMHGPADGVMDVTKGTTTTPALRGYAARPGYDLPTGIGTVGIHIAFRTRARIETFFGGFMLAAPGLVDVAEWPDRRGVRASVTLWTAAGVALAQR